MRIIQGIIEVTEILDVLGKGVTLPVKCSLKNGNIGIIKYMNNPFGQKVLINELVGYYISDLIDLTIPEYGICDFSEDVIFNTNKNEEIDAFNAGLAFFTKWYPKTIPATLPGMLSRVDNKETEKIILFDHIVNNFDRHNGNLLINTIDPFTLYTIDNSHIFFSSLESTVTKELMEKEILSPKLLNSNKEVYDRLHFCLGFNSEKMLSEAKLFKKRITDDEIEKLKKMIPEEWLNAEYSGYLDEILEILTKRISLIDEICDMIIMERRKN